MAKAAQHETQKPTALEQVLAIINATPKAREMLEGADNTVAMHNALAQNAELFNEVADKMAAAFIFAQDPGEGRKPAISGSLKAAFTQSALKLRRELPDAENLPYILHKLAMEVSQVKVRAINDIAAQDKVSAIEVLRRDAGIEVVTTEPKTVKINKKLPQP